MSLKLSSLKIPILDDALMDKIAAFDEKDQTSYLFLSPHPNFSGRWYVDSLAQGFFLDFEDIIGKYRTVSPASLSEFLDRAEGAGYNPVFTEDPFQILTSWDSLNEAPEFSLNSEMENTTNGMLSFQLQGFNYLRETPRGGIALWSTGTGKTALEAALIRQHIDYEGFEVVIAVCKKNNKVDTQRKLHALGGIASIILDGTPKKRLQLFEQITEQITAGDPVVVITNYEKLRDNTDEFIDLISGRNVVFFWDEMPTKLSNDETKLYASVRSVLYDSEKVGIKWDERKPNKLRQYMLSATPIENSPTGLLNQVRLIDPTVWPSIKEWERKFVAGRDFFTKEPDQFRDLDRMGLEVEHITHQVDKSDPDIAKLFPDVQEEVIYVDWSPQDRKLYDDFLGIAKDLVKDSEAGVDVNTMNPLQLIGVLQMICDAPSMVQRSGENRAEFEELLSEATNEDEWDDLQRFISGSEAALALLDRRQNPITDDYCNKLDALCDLITKKYDNEKILVFSRLASYIQPIITKRFDELGISYVVFRGTDKQRQEAKDQFRNDPDIQVFLSSDAGSDSIDLPEARVNINYDLPMTYARKVQRRNRNHRINSQHEYVIFIDLLMPDSVEDRIADIVAKKEGYHLGIFKGKATDESISARMTQADL